MSNNNSKFNPLKRWILIALAIILAGTLIWGISWATYSRPPLPEALTALESDDLVEVSQDPWLTFTPTGDIKAGLIFYPGGRIDPRGYAPLLREIASEGYLVVVPSMPINMAIFDTNAADEIIDHFNEIKSWGIAGHSVGGTSAAIYTANNPGKIAGLAIWLPTRPIARISLKQICRYIQSTANSIPESIGQQSRKEKALCLQIQSIWKSPGEITTNLGPT